MKKKYEKPEVIKVDLDSEISTLMLSPWVIVLGNEFDLVEKNLINWTDMKKKYEKPEVIKVDLDSEISILMAS